MFSSRVFPKHNILQLQQNIVTLAKNVALEEVVEADVDQLLQSHEEDLSNEELVHLEQEPAAEEESENAPAALHQLTTGELSAAFTHFEAGLQVLTSSICNNEWKLKVSRAISGAINCYRKNCTMRKRGAQSTCCRSFFNVCNPKWKKSERQQDGLNR